MGPRNPDEDGDLEIQVSSVRQPSSDEVSGDPGEAKPLFAAVRSRREQRRRSIIVTATLAVALVALVLSIAPTREALLGAAFGPTPTATDAVRAGEDNLYVTMSPNWGSVSLDDKPLAHLPVEGVEQPLRLSRGVHVLRWQFDPIIRYACVLTVPSSDKDDCPARVGIAPHKKGIARVVPLQLSLSTVAPEYYNSLTAAIQAALDAQQSTEIVRPGELYLGPYDQTTHRVEPVAATQPLRATLRFVPDMGDLRVTCPAITSGPGVNCMMNGDCREICTAPWQTGQNTGDGMWKVYITAHASWHIATLDGRSIIEEQADAGGTELPGNDEIPVPIAVGWDGSHWHVSSMIGTRNPASPLPDLVCASAWADVQNSFVAPPDPGGWQAVTVNYIPGNPSVDGCLLVMRVAGQPPLLVLHRFGVALAANATTARELCCPALPVADAYEQQLAQHILGTQQGG